MFEVVYGSRFKKDLKNIQKRNYDIKLFKEVVISLMNGEALSQNKRDHYLSGKWKGSRECHIEPDWLLIYRVEDNIIILERMGSHSDLFKM